MDMSNKAIKKISSTKVFDESVKKHIKENHLVKNIVCTGCGEKCVDSKAFKDHNYKIHRIYKKRSIDIPKPSHKQAIIETCIWNHWGDEFANSRHNKLNLQYHIKAKHGNPSDLLPCKYCGQLFLTKLTHSKHEALHSDPTIPCHQCGKLFHTQQYLKRHMLNFTRIVINCHYTVQYVQRVSPIQYSLRITWICI